MRNVRITGIFGFLWEILRFALISLIIIYYINPGLDLTVTLLVLWAATAQLLFPAGMVLFTFLPERYGNLGRFFALGKALSILMVLAILVQQSGFGRIVAALVSVLLDGRVSADLSSPKLLPSGALFLAGGVAFVDTVILVYLLVNKPRTDE